MIKFYYNGIKKNNKLIKGHWNKGSNVRGADIITFYCSSYDSCGLDDIFPVQNESDVFTGYFEKDHFEIEPTNKLYGECLSAYCKQEIKRHPKIIKSYEKRKALYQNDTKYCKEMRDYFDKEIERQNQHYMECKILVSGVFVSL